MSGVTLLKMLATVALSPSQRKSPAPLKKIITKSSSGWYRLYERDGEGPIFNATLQSAHLWLFKKGDEYIAT